MRGGNLSILGHRVKGQGQLCPPARGCHALHYLVSLKIDRYLMHVSFVLQFNMDYTVTFEPSNLHSSDLCVVVVRSAFTQLTSDLATLTSLSGVQGCPDITASYNTTVDEGEKCQSGLNSRVADGDTVCCELSWNTWVIFMPIHWEHRLIGSSVCLSVCPRSRPTLDGHKVTKFGLLVNLRVAHT